MALNPNIALGAAPPQQNNSLNMLLQIMQMQQMAQRNKLLDMQMTQAQETRPYEIAKMQAEADKARLAADRDRRVSSVYQDPSKFMEPAYAAVPPVPDELGGGPSREQGPMQMNVNRLGQMLLAAGSPEGEKILNHQAQREQARANLAATMVGREMQNDTRQAGIDAANERHRQMLEQRRWEATNRAIDDRRRRDQNLKPGERWAADGTTVEVIPGSSEWNRRSNLHSRDWTDVEMANQKADIGISNINRILGADEKGNLPENLPQGFQRNFGGYNAYASRLFPDALNTKADIEQLKSTLKNAGLDMMRSGGSIGQITEREWKYIESMLATITPELSETAARDKLVDIRNRLERIRTIAQTGYENEWRQQPQFYKGGNSGVKRITNDAEYNALPSGTEFIGPDGRTRKKP